MIRALFTSSTGMNAQSTSLDNIANNLANVNTNGFKRGEAAFQDLIYVNFEAPGGQVAQGLQSPTGTQIGSGVRVSGITKIFQQGGLVNTNNPLDIAIEGDGFLQVTMPNGDQAYTRDGALRINAQGNLVTADGFQINPQISIPPQAISITIGVDGTISVVNAGAVNTSVVLGQLTMARFQNPAGLNAQGRNLFLESASSGPAILATPGQNGLGLIQQGFLERSNVDAVTELVGLILAQRAYEFNTRSVRTADNMLAATTELVR